MSVYNILPPTEYEGSYIQSKNCRYLFGPQPKVTLLHATPEWVVAQATKGYTGHYSNIPLSPVEVDQFWHELGATKLKEPLAMAQCFFLIEDVTRAFTHQLARYKLGINMVQESQRFSIQDNQKAAIVIPAKYIQHNELLESFLESCEQALENYKFAIETGLAVQDARAILPTHICTRLYVNVNMLTLAHIYDQRSCCQAQEGEWEKVISQFKSELSEFPHYAATLKAPWEDGNCINCGFGASFDRPCKFADKFMNNLHVLQEKK